MFYNFLLDKIQTDTSLHDWADYFCDLLSPATQDELFIKHNADCLASGVNFLKNDSDFLVVQGFMGTGKSKLIKYIEKLLNPNVVIIRFDCMESLSLDDILLSFYRQFKKYHADKIINLPKINSTDFNDKINACINSTDKPILIVVDSLENVFNSENASEFTNFIKHLMSLTKLKFIFGARFFDYGYFEDQNPKTEKIALKPFTKEETAKFLQENQIKADDLTVEKYYKETKGIYLYINLSIYILKIFNLGVKDLLEEFKRKNIGFDEFLFAKVLSLAPQNFHEILRVFSVMRVAGTQELFKRLNLLEKDELDYLRRINVLYFVGRIYYMKNYLKEEILKEIDSYAKLKIHKLLANYYSSQLPLRTNERDIKISRTTMRKEISYHNSCIKQLMPANVIKPKRAKAQSEMDYISYSKSEWNLQKTKKAQNAQDNLLPNLQKYQKQGKNEHDIKLSQEEIELLNTNDDQGIMFAQESGIAASETDSAAAQEFTLDKLLEQAQKSEEKYDYAAAQDYYKQALEKENDKKYDTKKYLIITKLAIVYQKNNKPEEAVKNFERVYLNYIENKEISKANYIMLNIAQIHKDTYKFSEAKNLYENILKADCEKSHYLLARCRLDLAEIEDYSSNNSKTMHLYEEALASAKKTEDAKLIAEAYFKYALCLDDNSQTDAALENYINCINVSKDTEINLYLSSSYTNMAAIYTEQNESAKAIDYYNLALEIDEKQFNLEGQYFIYSKLGALYKRINNQQAINILMKGLFAAKQLKDYFYIACAHLDIGDFYYSVGRNEMALKFYIFAQKYVSKESSGENAQKIRLRIKDIKVKMGKEKFLEFLTKLKSNAGK